MVLGVDKIFGNQPTFTIGQEAIVKKVGTGETPVINPQSKANPNYEQYDCYKSPVMTGSGVGDKFDSNRWLYGN